MEWVDAHKGDRTRRGCGVPGRLAVIKAGLEEAGWSGCLLGLHQRNQDPGSQWRRSLAGQRALRCVQRCSGPHPFLLNPSSHSAPLINYLRNITSITLLEYGGGSICELKISRHDDGEIPLSKSASARTVSRQRVEVVYSEDVPTPEGVSRARKATGQTTPIAIAVPPSPGVWEPEECRLRRQPALPHARVCLHIRGKCPQPPPPLQAAR